MRDGRHHSRFAGRGRAGFTLVELLVALAISALAGMGVAMMLASVSAGTKSQNDIRRASVSRQVAIHRVSALTRDAAMVLAVDGDHLVLWKGDVAGNGRPNLSELRLIEWDAETAEVWVYETEGEIEEDPAYSLNEDDFSAITAAEAGSARFPGTLILDRVTAFEPAVDEAGDLHAARLIRLRLTMPHESGPDVATVVSALRLVVNVD